MHGPSGTMHGPSGTIHRPSQTMRIPSMTMHSPNMTIHRAHRTIHHVIVASFLIAVALPCLLVVTRHGRTVEDRVKTVQRLPAACLRATVFVVNTASAVAAYTMPSAPTLIP
jgi:hypothetical protein